MRMGAEGFEGVIAPREVGFAERCVDFVVADLMKQNGRPALPAPELWNEVVQALADIRRDRPAAEAA